MSTEYSENEANLPSPPSPTGSTNSLPELPLEFSARSFSSCERCRITKKKCDRISSGCRNCFVSKKGPQQCVYPSRRRAGQRLLRKPKLANTELLEIAAASPSPPSPGFTYSGLTNFAFGESSSSLQDTNFNTQNLDSIFVDYGVAGARNSMSTPPLTPGTKDSEVLIAFNQRLGATWYPKDRLFETADFLSAIDDGFAKEGPKSAHF